MRKTTYALPLVLSLLSDAALAADPLKIQEKANGVLALMSYSILPDLASSSLQISASELDNPSIVMTQFGGGATMSKDFPLYLEGAAAYSRYDPRFVVTEGTETRRLPVKWTSVSATGGVGWDFPLSDEVVLRPIGNVALGYITSDANAARFLVSRLLDRDIEFLDNGHMTAAGLGGSLMLDWEQVRPEHEIDVELRYSYIHLQSVGGDEIVDGQADAETLSLWSRWRAPTGVVMLQRPLRYVLEFSLSEYLGDQRGVLGFDRLATFGVGFELDSSAYDVFITRTRLVLRHVVGDHVSGMSLGLAMSF
ncbi:autotransporter outer membrane beta-barrel domain-containing protein [Pseudomonas sp. UL073]|uniref:Autotransporter outer membrane beta-barrel domain-containing protein n=1 Tax=Zestomonas insulae TaxID=2809017 RepID=A0ABS2IFG9_9GAMM|nr:autotransporter domain-containing protein [Pseudomonas insulae]MBM7061839.1 autotransporter outer membrane beta-barrel domain-containing protein [Pseudomonas insulae]